MKAIKRLYNAENAPIADLVTYRVLPARSLDQIDPFLFLNHHGPQTYGPGNHGLPFGPHPHRGMETVTFILAGEIMHKDSGGHESVITAGGVQWMTAGRGLIHAEVSSERFKEMGGDLEILQLWLNLPAKLKMTEPAYLGLQKEQIPAVTLDDGRVTVNVISGNRGDKKGAFKSLTDVHLSTVYFKSDGQLPMDIPQGRNILFYVIKGKLSVNGTTITMRQLAEFTDDVGTLSLAAMTDTILLFGHAKPLSEPVVAQGPFVMNTQQEIFEAYNDYRNGKFGIWNE